MYSSSTLIKPSAMKKWPYKKGDNLVVFYCLGASEIWPNKGVVFGARGFIIGQTTLYK